RPPAPRSPPNGQEWSHGSEPSVSPRLGVSQPRVVACPSLAPSTLRNGRGNRIRGIPRQTAPQWGLNWKSTRYSGAADRLGELGGDSQISDPGATQCANVSL